MRKYAKGIKIGLVLLLLGLAIFGYFQLKIKDDKSIDISLMEENISKILELSTAKYDYVNVAIFKDSKTFKGLNLPFTSKKFIIKYSGYIKAGLDVKDIDLDVSDENAVRVIVKKPIILDNVINEEEVYIYDEKETIFNKLSFNDLYELLIDEKIEMEKEAIGKGLLAEAENNSRELIESLLKTMGFEDIQITYK